MATTDAAPAVMVTTVVNFWPVPPAIVAIVAHERGDSAALGRPVVSSIALEYTTTQTQTQKKKKKKTTIQQGETEN